MPKLSSSVHDVCNPFVINVVDKVTGEIKQKSSFSSGECRAVFEYISRKVEACGTGDEHDPSAVNELADYIEHALANLAAKSRGRGARQYDLTVLRPLLLNRSLLFDSGNRNKRRSETAWLSLVGAHYAVQAADNTISAKDLRETIIALKLANCGDVIWPDDADDESADS